MRHRRLTLATLMAVISLVLAACGGGGGGGAAAPTTAPATGGGGAAATTAPAAAATAAPAAAATAAPAADTSKWFTEATKDTRTDLKGASIKAILGSDGPSTAWENAAAAKFTELSGINVQVIPGDQ